MYSLYNNELLFRLKTIYRGLITECREDEFSNYFSKKQITSIKELKKLITKVYRLENPSTIIEAVRKGNCNKLVKLLENKKINIDAQDKSGYTALHLAIDMSQNLAIVSALLKAGADPDICSHDGRSPLECAMDYELFEIEKILRDYGATDPYAD